MTAKTKKRARSAPGKNMTIKLVEPKPRGFYRRALHFLGVRCGRPDPLDVQALAHLLEEFYKAGYAQCAGDHGVFA